jgi:cytoskeleton protein RodZ
MSELGEKLREAREEQGLSLEDVEESTHIRRELLEALENGDYARLPEPVYVRGFVRGYVGALGLDPEPFLALVPRAGNERRRPQQLVLDRPLQQPLSRPRALRRLLLGLLAVLMIAALVWWFVSTHYLHLDPLAPLGDSSLRSTGVPTATTFAPTATPLEASPSSTPPAVVETGSGNASPITRSPTPSPTLTATASPSPSATPTATSTPSLGVEVRMRVDAVTWIRVTVDGQGPVETLLEVGDDQVWQGNETIDLTIGNAGGAYLTVNGEELGYLGEDGEVVAIEFGPSDLP